MAILGEAAAHVQGGAIRAGPGYGSVATTDHSDASSGYEVLQQRRASLASDTESPSINGIRPAVQHYNYTRQVAPALDGSTQVATVINVLKMCMGSGMLALPYAYVNGGYGLSITGVLVIAAWNMYAMDRLLRCKDLLDSSSRGAEDVDVNQTYAFLGKKAFGQGGGLAVDLCIIVTLYGVCITYLITATQLLVETPLSIIFVTHPTLTTLVNTLLCTVVVLPLSSARTLSLLSYSSLIGLVALAFAFFVIITTRMQQPDFDTNSLTSLSAIAPYAWPDNWQEFSKFFGVAAFCFGVPPLTFPIQGSMRHPEAFPRVMAISLTLVSLLYILVPGTVAAIYPTPVITPDIILVLPSTAIANTVRICVAIVCLLSYPLALVPLAHLLETLIKPCNLLTHLTQQRHRSRDGGGGLPRGYFTRERSSLVDFTRLKRKGFFGTHLLLRFFIILSTAICAAVIPCFGMMVALTGAFTVSLISFVLPPLFYIFLFHTRLTPLQVLFELTMIGLGLSACTTSTWLTATAGLGRMFRGHKCQ